jgi:hypothetical protein
MIIPMGMVASTITATIQCKSRVSCAYFAGVPMAVGMAEARFADEKITTRRMPQKRAGHPADYTK